MATSHSTTAPENQANAARRLKAEAQRATAHFDAVKRQVRVARTVLKRVRKLAKASKKAAKQARKMAEAALAGLQIRTRKVKRAKIKTATVDATGAHKAAAAHATNKTAASNPPPIAPKKLAARRPGAARKPVAAPSFAVGPKSAATEAEDSERNGTTVDATKVSSNG